jgi:tetratricopeptide (TPR) repeat protein/tRNA A-37 threonylcarbamoyl transferase component Bud32
VGSEQVLKPGTVLGDRFEVVRRVGSGGMGTVYRAQDRITGRTVALKVLRLRGVDEAKRFAREAELLAELRHPRIVRYIDHGTTPGGDHFLAMEWLEGRPLSSRLRLGPVPLGETLSIIAQSAEALGAAHRNGFVHRDIKPSNLILVQGSSEDVRIIDFGVARRTAVEGADADTALTKTGALVGTTAYMAPEQAEGKRNLDARIDVYALGVVFYECLTGKRAFKASKPRDVLAKILLEDPPRLQDAAPEMPTQVDALISRMMSRDRWQRPANGDEVLRELEALKAELELGSEGSSTTTTTTGSALTQSEQRMVWTLLIEDPARVGTGETAPTLADSEATMVEGQQGQGPDHESDRLLAAAEAAGGQLVHLADGRSVVSFPGASADGISRAALCALELRAAFPGLAFAVTAGAEEGATPDGGMGKRGLRVLSLSGPGVIRVEESAAGLLESRFVVEWDESGACLTGERTSDTAIRGVMGQPTPCVGRHRELQMLQSVLEEAVEEPVARAVVLTAPAGAGKSRLRQEFVSRVREQHEDVRVLLGRADVLGAGSPFGLIADALRRAAGIGQQESLSVSRSKLRGRVARTMAEDAPNYTRTVEFLGEMIRVPFADEGSSALAAAREDAMLMGDSIRTAWEDFLASECAAGPVLLILEDAHLGDRPSMNLVDAALRNLEDRPLMVVALARPEIEQRFPDLWAERYAQPMRLPPLTRRAREELVRSVLGEQVDAGLVSKIVQRSEGNALFLEELIRAVARGKEEQLPESLLAMVQARLDDLSPEDRRVLRGASVFGESFWMGGVIHMLGGPQMAREVSNQLEQLERHELIERRGASTHSNERQYAFRHLLVRDGAYAMLTHEDRVLGHRLAGEWLEQTGEPDALLLAEHYVRGELPEKAAWWYLRAAERALEGNDLPASIHRAERALECSDDQTLRGRAQLVRAEGLGWSGHFAEAAKAAQSALELVPRRSARWFHALGETCHAMAQLERFEELGQWLPDLRKPAEDLDTAATQVVTMCRVGWLLRLAGQVEEANELLDLVVQRVDEGGESMARVRSWRHGAAAVRAYYDGDLAAYLHHSEQSAVEFEQANDLRRACAQRSNVAVGYDYLGHYERAEQILQENIQLAERLGLVKNVSVSMESLAYVLLSLGRPDEARDMAYRALEGLAEGHIAGLVHKCLASIAQLEGDTQTAEDEARHALRLLELTPGLQAEAFVTLADILLDGGRCDEALEQVQRAERVADELGGPDALGPGELSIYRVRAESHTARGEHEQARSSVRRGMQRLRERANRISDAGWRQSFLECVPAHRKLAELASAWGIET